MAIKETQYFKGTIYNYHYFEEIDTEEKAYWLGFLIGDGYIVPTKRTVGLTVSKEDKLHIHKYAKALGLERKDVKEYTANTNFGVFQTCRVLLSNKIMYTSIVKKGFTNKTTWNTCKVKVQKNLLRHLLRGIFDADGSISTSKSQGRIRADFELSVNEQIAHWFIEQLKKLGFTETIAVRKDRNFWRVRANSLSAIAQLQEILYEDSNISLERKKKAIEIAVNKLRKQARNSQRLKGSGQLEPKAKCKDLVRGRD